MSEKYKKPDYTVKNFDILNKHAEEGVAREKEITRLRRAQTNWQNAKNISLVLIALGILALFIGKAIQIANQKDMVELSQNHNHSSAISSSHHNHAANNGNYSKDSSHTNNREPYNDIVNISDDSEKAKKSNLATSSKRGDKLDQIKKEKPNQNVAENSASTQNKFDSKNNIQKKITDKSTVDDKSIIEKSSENVSNVLSAIMNPFSNNKSKEEKGLLVNEISNQDSKSNPSELDVRKSDVNNSLKDKKAQTKKTLDNNKLINETPSKSTFNKIYEQVYGETFEPSKKEVLISQDKFGNSIIIKEYIFKINKPQIVIYKNTSYEVFTTYYFKSTEQDSLTYPMKQRCWAYTPAKIVLALSEKDNKNPAFVDKSQQGLALQKANLKDSDLVNFRSSCKFI